MPRKKEGTLSRAPSPPTPPCTHLVVLSTHICCCLSTLSRYAMRPLIACDIFFATIHLLNAQEWAGEKKHAPHNNAGRLINPTVSPFRVGEKEIADRGRIDRQTVYSLPPFFLSLLSYSSSNFFFWETLRLIFFPLRGRELSQPEERRVWTEGGEKNMSC